MSSQFVKSRVLHRLRWGCFPALSLLLAGVIWWWLTWPDRTLASFVAAIQRGDTKEAAILCKADCFGRDLADDPAVANLFVPYMTTRPFHLGERIIGTARINQHHPTDYGTITTTMLVVERGVILFHPDRYGLKRGWSLSLGQSYSNALADPDPRTRKAALRALGDMGTRAQAFVPRIRDALQDKDEDVRRMSQWAWDQIVEE